VLQATTDAAESAFGGVLHFHCSSGYRVPIITYVALPGFFWLLNIIKGDNE